MNSLANQGRNGALAVLLITFFFLWPASSSAVGNDQPRSWQSCGTVFGAVALYSLKSTSNCQQARRVGKKWRSKVLSGQCQRFRCRARGFLCQAKPPAYISYAVKCRQGNRRIFWRVSVD